VNWETIRQKCKVFDYEIVIQIDIDYPLVRSAYSIFFFFPNAPKNHAIGWSVDVMW
jgi:hypothetical protein